MTVDKTTLKNGIRIVSKTMPHARSVSMGVWVNVGARDESELESGLSHFIEHMIFKGTRKRSAFQIAKEFDAIGGHTNAFTAMENTCYHARVMDTHTETMVDILSDIFINSVFDPAEIDKERPVILQEIGMVEDSPEEYIHVLSGHNYWGDNPLGRSILGSPQNIIQFDAPMIKKFFSRLYQPERIVISAAGKLDHHHLVDLVQPAFETIQPGNDIPQRITPQGCSVVDTHPPGFRTDAHLSECKGIIHHRSASLHVLPFKYHPGRQYELKAVSGSAGKKGPGLLGVFIHFFPWGYRYVRCLCGGRTRTGSGNNPAGFRRNSQAAKGTGR